MDFTTESAPYHSTPHAILGDCDDRWRICFEPDIAGIIIDEPHLISKTIISDLYPHLVEAWETQQAQQKTEAHRIEQKFLAFMRRFNNDSSTAFTPRPPEPGVACDQHLLPGMGRHWGELRQCAAHPQDHAPFRVCKGCRVSHQTQRSALYDRAFVAARGARVPLCDECAAQAVQSHGVSYRGCVCDAQWTCYRCREAELVRLSLSRSERHIDGRCGRCREGGTLVRHVEICLACQGARVYAGMDE